MLTYCQHVNTRQSELMQKLKMPIYCVHSQPVYTTMCAHMFHVQYVFTGHHMLTFCENVNREGCEVMKKGGMPIYCLH